jgi:AMP nucleosidase
VLRPEAWLMIGHCGGLRDTQRIGDYVLAHAYLRDDHVLDPVLPPGDPHPRHRRSAARPGPGGGDHQRRRRREPEKAHAHRHRRHHRRPQLGAALRPRPSASACRARSPSIWRARRRAAQGYRFRVPYGTLLCVSDKPLHGEIKMPGQANRFYEEAIAAHLKIGTTSCELLRAEGQKLHSRKLRAFNEPPFR